MKILIFILTLLYSEVLLANEIEPIKSDKLDIISNISNPDEMPLFEPNDALSTLPRFSIGVKFDIDDVQAIIINDMNIKNNKCGSKLEPELFFMSFDNPNTKHKKINTRIKVPCVADYKAVLELTVRTSTKKVYYNIITLKSKYRDSTCCK